MTDLVKRLRRASVQKLPLNDYFKEAADRIEALEAENQRLWEAGQAVVDRWDTPLWKEAEATGYVINRLRAALAETSTPPRDGV